MGDKAESALIPTFPPKGEKEVSPDWIGSYRALQVRRMGIWESAKSDRRDLTFGRSPDTLG